MARVCPPPRVSTPQFIQLRSRFEHRTTVRLSLALCRAGGSRGLPASAPHYRADADLVQALEVASSSRRRSQGAARRQDAAAVAVSTGKLSLVSVLLWHV
eukprot:464468-Rhodomonas_salina.2